MLSIRFTLAKIGGLLAVLLLAGSFLVCQHSRATDEIKPAVTAPANAPPPAATILSLTPGKPNSRTPAKKIANGPSWQALTTAQQLALVPLAGEWDGMDSLRKEKWIAIGNRYARMSPAEQNRIQTRMRDWIKLTPQERRAVRQSYASTKKLNSDQKTAQWQQYLQLSDEQKQQLAEQKLRPVPATAVSRAQAKSKPLLPIKPPMSHAGVPVTATATASAITVAPTGIAPAAPATGLAIQPNSK